MAEFRERARRSLGVAVMATIAGGTERGIRSIGRKVGISKHELLSEGRSKALERELSGFEMG